MRIFEPLTELLSGSRLEGPAHRVSSACRSRIPDAMLSAAAVKSRNYDRMTLEIAHKAMVGGGSAIDVGANHGDILRELVKYSHDPHWAFEPIPAYADRLRRRFPDVTVEHVALSDFNGSTEFRLLPAKAAYSSLLRRPEIENSLAVQRLTVEVRTLDDCIPDDARVTFVKIDVEGAEAAVLRGARTLMRRCQPVTVFECASARLHECITALEGTELRVSFLADFLADIRRPAAEVMRTGREHGEYCYVAAGY